jgi:hypothetical protein
MLAVARFALSGRDPGAAAERRDALAKSGVLAALVAVVGRCAERARTATVGCSVISALATGDAEMQEALGEAGAVQAIVRCVEHNFEDGDGRMIEAGLRALTSLTCVLENREKMRKSDGIKAVIATMGRHSQAPLLQTEGATLLANCAFGSEENKRCIAEKFGVDLVRLLPRRSRRGAQSGASAER